MFGAQIRVGHVSHHNMSTAEAQFTLLLLGGVENVFRQRTLLFVLAIDLEHLNLDARSRRPAAPPKVVLFRRYSSHCCALAHSVQLVDVDAQGAKILQGLKVNGGSASDTHLHAIQTQSSADLGQHHAFGQTIAASGAPRLSHLEIALRPEPVFLGPCRTRLLADAAQNRHHSLRLRPDLHQSLSEFLPHARDAEEDSGPHKQESILQRAFLEIIGAGTIHSAETLGCGSQCDRHDNIKQKTSNM
mmetsp:Transcript_49223/g.107333  ORF Transcript_49223/g.107333 Transcript_49223/m.107333 type:complete len:245 (+) Transcript_49223:1186-1920(+)